MQEMDKDDQISSLVKQLKTKDEKLKTIESEKQGLLKTVETLKAQLEEKEKEKDSNQT